MPDVFFLCQMPQNYARSGIHYAELRPLIATILNEKKKKKKKKRMKKKKKKKRMKKKMKNTRE